MTETRTHVVHQALHGYRDGHTLIAASTELPRQARAEIQRLSDRSGPGEEPGFESYLTAYPVPGMSAYAFGCTWSAPEMPRPGCVWTHTLFVPHVVLAKLVGLHSLLSLFRRPGPDVLALPDTYQEPLEVPSLTAPAPRVTQSDGRIVSVIELIYGSERPVFVESESAAEIQALFLGIWAQQWKQLRQYFTFCTGSLAPRTAWGALMDLQAAPRARALRVQRATPEGSIYLTRSHEPDPEDRPPWAVRAARVLSGGVAREEFLRFMHTFGGHAGAGRTTFPTLVDALLALGDTTLSPQERLLRVGFLFPRPESALRLKRALLGVPQPLMRDMPALDTLFAVYELPNPAPYAGSGVADAKRLLGAWEAHPADRTLLLERWSTRNWNRLGRMAFDEAIVGLPVSAIADALADAREQVIHAVVTRRVDVLASHRFWELSHTAILTGIAAAASAHTPSEVWRGALSVSEAVVRPDIWTSLPNAAAEPLAQAILDVLANDPEHLHPAADAVLPMQTGLTWVWIDGLAEPLAPAALLLARYPELAKAASNAEGPASRLARRAEHAPSHLAAGDTVAAALLGAGLIRRSGASREVIELCFRRVHTALETGRLSAEAHAVLRENLFPGMSDVSVDALRRRLVERYEAEHWGWAPLVRAVAGGSVVEQLLRLFAPPPKKSPDKKR